MVTVDADGYQEVRPRNGVLAILSNFRAQRAGLSQRERKAGPRLQKMFDLLGGGDSQGARAYLSEGVAAAGTAGSGDSVSADI